MSQAIVLHPNAKINLGLNIVSRRPDGYHDIETVFYPIPLTDKMTIETSEAFSFTQTGTPLDCRPEANLVVRAIRALAGDEVLPRLRVTLEKHIPSGAGLGGGSSDAAAAMCAVANVMDLPLTPTDIEQKLATLGADCPFFVRNKPVFATGIGNIFTPIELSLSGWNLALVKPYIHVSTREAYAMVEPAQPAMPLTEIIRRPVVEWQHLMANDFERSVFSAHPEIEEIKQRLLQCGATYASMSGSGSTVFALFEEDTPLPDLNRIFPAAFTWWGRL